MGYVADRGYSPRTERAYAFDLLAFARWLVDQDRTVGGVTTDALLRFLTFCRAAVLPRWFTASPCRAAVEGPPPSPAQHRNHQRDLLHRNLQPRSWRTVIGEPGDDHVAPSGPIPPMPDPQVENVMKVHVGEQRR